MTASQTGTVRERAHLLKVGKTGVLKVAASPQFIEGAISTFLHRYAERYPNVELKLTEAIGWAEIRGMLERGEIDLGQTLAHAEPNDRRFTCHPLGEVDLLAAWPAGKPSGEASAISIEGLAGKPLLVLDTSYIFRRTFDAACRLAKVEPNIAFESRTPHTLLAMAESGHGIAIIPSTLRTHRHSLRIASVTYRGRALSEPLAIFWDRKRHLPDYAVAFCDMLSTHVRESFPVTRASQPQFGTAKKRAAARQASMGRRRS